MDHATKVRNAINDAGLNFDDVMNYLFDKNDSYRKYVRYMADGQRRGQAFFNALDKIDQDRLVNTDADPYQSDDRVSVIYAVIYLLEN